MAVGLVMQLEGVGQDKYDAVMQELGLPLHDESGTSWPTGIISHVAGARPDGGWTVVDIWESQKDFDDFFSSRLGPAFERVGGMPEPQVTPFEVHNTFRHGR